MYDPSLGRFLSVDPLIGHPESTQGINPYSYVENNPLNQTDPTGEDATGTCQTEACPALSGGLGTHEGPREAQAAIQGAVSNGTISAAEGKTLSKVFAGGANTISGLGSAISFSKTLADGNRAMAQTAAQWNSFTAHNASSFNVNTHSQPGGGAPTLAPPAGDGSPSGPNGLQNAAFNFGCGLGIGCSIMDSGANPNGDAYAAGQITGIVFSPVVALGIVVLGDGNPASDAAAGDLLFGDAALESESEIPIGTNLIRNFGGYSDLYAPSWTTEPIGLQSRNALGLGTENSAEFVAHGTVIDNTGITTKEADEWGRFAGGGQETLVPFPRTQIQIRAVTMPDEPLPWYLPTDPKP